MSGCNDSDFLEKPFTETSVSRDLARRFHEGEFSHTQCRIAIAVLR